MWDWQYTFEILPELLGAVPTTLIAAVGGTALAMILGLVLAGLRRTRLRPIRYGIELMIQFVRNTPILVQLYLLFYVTPDIGILAPALVVGIVGLGLHFAPYLAEVYRAGIESVPRGQWEAAAALNLGTWAKWRRVILPQAMPAIVPVLGNYVIAILKETPLLSAITVVELLGRAQEIGAETFRYFEPLTMAGILFLALALGASAAIRLVERRLARAQPDRFTRREPTIEPA